MQDGFELVFTVTNQGALRVNNANITTPNVVAGKGVIHIIDAVLEPSDAPAVEKLDHALALNGSTSVFSPTTTPQSPPTKTDSGLATNGKSSTPAPLTPPSLVALPPPLPPPGPATSPPPPLPPPVPASPPPPDPPTPPSPVPPPPPPVEEEDDVSVDTATSRAAPPPADARPVPPDDGRSGIRDIVSAVLRTVETWWMDTLTWLGLD